MMNIPRKQDDCRNTVINEKLKKNYDIGSGTINMEYYGSPRTNEQCKKIENIKLCKSSDTTIKTNNITIMDKINNKTFNKNAKQTNVHFDHKHKPDPEQYQDSDEDSDVEYYQESDIPIDNMININPEVKYVKCSGKDYHPESECDSKSDSNSDANYDSNEDCGNEENNIINPDDIQMRKCDACIEKKCKVLNNGTHSYDNGRVYCGLHNKTCPNIDKLKANNKKPCVNHNRKCRNELDIDNKSKKCDDCVNKGREKEKKRTEKNSINRNTENTCWKCRKHFDDPTEFIDAKGQKTAKCKFCRIKQAVRDRKSRAMGTKKSYPMSEETKEKKKQWREDNYDKYAGYWIKYRAKKIKTMDENYWKRNSEYSKKRLDMLSSEERWVLNENKRKDVKAKLKYYQDRAKRNDITWNLSDDAAFELFDNNCFYCDCEPDDYHNGIDRINNEDGYSENNVVSACRICNIMKGCLDMDIFIKRCEHILTNLKIINGRTYDNIFPISVCSKYEVYKNRADEKKLQFDLTEEQFSDIAMKECFLCGIQSCNNHLNGIDRFDSNKGYTINNSNSCCTDCNYMKNNYDYNTIIDKITKIYIKHYSLIDKLINVKECIVRKGELNLYRYSQSSKRFIKSNVFFQNVDNGIWKYKYSLDECFFEMSKEYPDDDEITIQKFSINSDVHNIPYLTISQCHNITLHSDVNTDQIEDDINMVKMTHDSTLIVRIPNNHKKIYVIVTKHENKIKKIQFKYNKKVKGYCKCDSCNSHIIEKSNYYDPCHCDECMVHYMHGIVEKCFWCTESSGSDSNLMLYKNHDYRIDGNVNIIENYRVPPRLNNLQQVKLIQKIHKRKNKKKSLQRMKEKYQNDRTDENDGYDENDENESYDVQNEKNEHKINNDKVIGKGFCIKHKQEKEKKSKEQIREDAKLRKQISRQKMKEKYGDEKWKKIRAKEIQLDRLKAKNSDTNTLEKTRKELEMLKAAQ